MNTQNAINEGVKRSRNNLLKYLNDVYLFTQLLQPAIHEKSLSYKKNGLVAKWWPVPGGDQQFAKVRRNGAQIHQFLEQQRKRGVYESLVVVIISRIEAFIVECVEVVILQYPEKLKALAQNSISTDVILSTNTREELISLIVQQSAESLMYMKPKDYIEKLEKVLSIQIDETAIRQFIEAKATRDLIVHNAGEINNTYITKSGSDARGNLGEIVVVDEKYFKAVITCAKKLSGDMMKKIVTKYAS